MKVTLLDLGIGNLHSLAKAIARAAPEVTVTVDADAEVALRGDLLVLPGVGAFGAAASALEPARDRIHAALASGHPCLGICLGMQLLFEGSDEGGGAGLGLLRGRVTELRTSRKPHMGWSPIEPSRGAPDWPWPAAAYFAHSYAVRPEDPTVVLAETDLVEDRFASVVRFANTVGCQFHPEKSSNEGGRLLGAIVHTLVKRGVKDGRT